jgi:hypothetical protein
VTYDEWLIYAFKNLLLIFNVIDMLLLNNVGLLHCLYRILSLLHPFKPAYSHVSEGTYQLRNVRIGFSREMVHSQKSLIKMRVNLASSDASITASLSF